MKVTKINFSRLFNTGDYSHQELSIEVQVDEGEDPIQAVKRAKAFVNQFDPDIKRDKLNEAYRIVDDKENRSYNDVIRSEKLIELNNNGIPINDDDDLPF